MHVLVHHRVLRGKRGALAAPSPAPARTRNDGAMANQDRELRIAWLLEEEIAARPGTGFSGGMASGSPALGDASGSLEGSVDLADYSLGSHSPAGWPWKAPPPELKAASTSGNPSRFAVPHRALTAPGAAPPRSPVRRAAIRLPAENLPALAPRAVPGPAVPGACGSALSIGVQRRNSRSSANCNNTG